ncbi:MAG TPA: hypothetical protein VFD03_09460 [Clostridia bacterium]|nr:hypothetical protein [Clostridia bacterium]
MDVIGKTQYLKNMREELNSKKQLTQIYLIMFSLLYPQLAAIITLKQISHNGKFFLITLSLFFITFLFYYYLQIATAGDLTELNTFTINMSAVVAAMCFSFLVPAFFVLSIDQSFLIQVGQLTSYSRALMFSSISACFTCLFVNTLLIKTKKEIPIDVIAGEIIRLRSDQLIDMIKINMGSDVSSYDLVFLLLMYCSMAYGSIFLYSAK